MKKELSNSNIWIGVDLAKDSFDAAISPLGVKPADWRRLEVEHFANTDEGIAQFCAWAGKSTCGARCEGICVESTGAYSLRFVEALEGSALPRPSVVNPFRSVSFAKSTGARNKNDRIDAAILAVYGAIYEPEPARKVEPVQQRSRELDRLRQALVEERTAWENRLSQTQDGFARKSMEKVLQTLEQQIQTVEKELEKAVLEDPVLQEQIELLKSIPGIKRVTSMTLTVEMGDLRQYSRNELVSLTGLFAREHSSGTSVQRKKRMARGGGGRIRRDVYMGATSLQRSKSALGAYVNRLKSSGKEPMCALGALMRKMIVVARAVVISGQKYDPEKAARTRPLHVPKGGLTIKEVSV
jgi:transposase